MPQTQDQYEYLIDFEEKVKAMKKRGRVKNSGKENKKFGWVFSFFSRK